MCFRRKPDEKYAKELLEKYPNIKNVPNLMTPRTDEEVYERLAKGQQIVDQAVQRAQTLQAAALTSLLLIIDNVGSDKGRSAEDNLEDITNATRLITMSFGGLLQVRKEVIRNALGWPIARLCDWATPVGPENLFLDLGKRLNDKDSTRMKLGRRNFKNK